MDGIIDIIIAVLFIAIPMIFKAIGNKLEKSGKAEKAGKYKKIAEAMTDDDKSVFDEIETPVLDEILEKRRIKVYRDENEAEEEAVLMEPVGLMPVTENVISQIKTTRRPDPVRPTNKKTPILLEDEPEGGKKEKIDPKKLVIYSEIMEPKFKN